jgi:ribonucleoside-triphosphate reductase
LGQTISISHLAPYVRLQKEKILNDVFDSLHEIGVIKSDSIEDLTDEEFKLCEYPVKKRLQKEINAGIQTFMYQINTLQTSNG